MKDICLKFGSKDHCFETFKALGMTAVDVEGVEKIVGNIEYCAIDEIGVIYKPTGIYYDTNENVGFKIPKMEAISGYHVNVRLYGNSDRWPDLSPFTVTPSTPYRVWA